MSELDQQRLGELLSAYLDGELDAEQSQAVQRIVAQDPQARRLLEELRRTSGALAALPRHEAPAAVLQDLETHLERAQLLAEPDDRPAAYTRGASPLRWLSMAAMIGIAVIGGTWMMFTGREPRETPVAVQDRHNGDVASTAQQGSKTAAPPVTELRQGSGGDDAVALRSRRGAARSAAREPLTMDEEDAARPHGKAAEKSAATAPDFDVATQRSVRLKFTVRSEAERKRLITTLASAMRRYDGIDAPERGSVAEEPTARRTKPAYGDEGGPPAAGTGLEAVTVRVPAGRMDDLAADLQRLSGGGDVTLSAGPFEFRGWKETRFALGRTGDAARADDPEDAVLEDADIPNAPFSERLAWLTEALSALGVDQAPPAAKIAEDVDSRKGQPTSVGARPAAPLESVTELELADAADHDHKGETTAALERSSQSTTREPSTLTPPRIAAAGAEGEREEQGGDKQTLVQRRRAALHKRTASASAPAAEPGTTALHTRRDDARRRSDHALITLVIEIEVKEPAKTRTVPSPGPAAGHKPQTKPAAQPNK